MFTKKSILLVIIIVLYATIISNCYKDKNNLVGSNEEQVTESDAASAVALSLSPESSCWGINGFLSSSVFIKRNIALLKSIPSQILYDTTVNFSYNFPPYTYSKQITFSLKFIKRGEEWNYPLSRTDTIAVKINSEGVFETPRLSGSDSSYTSQLYIRGLLDSASYTLGGDYNWKGIIISKEKKGLEFNLNYILKFTDLEVLKYPKDIDSGTADITISGEKVKGKSFLFSGKITFQTGSQATLKLGNKTFILDLEHGDILM